MQRRWTEKKKERNKQKRGQSKRTERKKEKARKQRKGIRALKCPLSNINLKNLCSLKGFKRKNKAALK